MSVELVKSLCDWAAVILVGLTFVAGFGALRAGNIINERQAAQLRKFDADLTTAKADNLALQKQVTVLQADASVQREKAAVAEANLLTLRGQAEPRRLTGSQKEELAKNLSGLGRDGLTIVTPIMDGEAADFADDFKSAVESAKWQTLRITNRISSKYGVAVVTCEGTPEPVLAMAKKLSDALSKVGVAHESLTFKNGDASTSPAFQAGYLYLVVEHKPLLPRERK